jgi:hypothetical protein
LIVKLIKKEHSAKQFRENIVLGSKSQRLLLVGEVEVFGHF